MPQNERAAMARRAASRRTWWFWLLLLAMCGAGFLAYRMHAASPPRIPAEKSGANAPRPMTVTVATAHVGDIDVYLNGLGTVIPFNTVTVRSRVDGQLMKILFREGQIVKEGEALAEIDRRPFEVQLTQAEGQMAHDRALLANAKVDLERYRTLFAQDSIARQQLDTQAALVRQYEGQVKADQGAIDSARLQLTYSRIIAPIPGRVGLRQVDVGNIVHAADTNGIVIITQLQPASVIFTIPEDSIPAVMKKLRTGEKLTADAYDRSQRNKLASGELMTVDNQIDITTGTVRLKAQFSNEDYVLFPNQFVNVRMLLDIKRSVIVVPTAAVQGGRQGSFVYVVRQDRTVELRAVTLGVTQASQVEVVSGLAAGEQVVIDGADKLRDGAKVEVAQSTARDGAAQHPRAAPLR